MKKLAILSALLFVALPLFAQLTPKPAPETRSATVGDVNGDGLTDVLDDTTWQRNVNGQLAAPIGLGITGRVLGVLDANGDGAVDLLTTAEAIYSMPPEGPYSIWMNDGHGHFVKFAAPTNTLPSAQGDIHLPPMIADFDGDGKDDFIVPYPHLYPDWATRDLAFYRSRGDGTFEQTDFVTIHLQSDWYMTQVGRQRIAAGDVTGDGKTDIVIKTTGGLLIVAGRGDGKFDALPERFTSFDYGVGDGLQIADIDGDRKNDVIWNNGNSLVTVFFGDGHGGFSRMATGQAGPLDPEGSSPTGATLALIHFSSTQRWDVALGSPHSNVSVMTYSNGTLHEAARITLAAPEPNEGPGFWYRGFNVFAGKFRTDSPADLYAFNSWDQPMAQRAFLLFQDKEAEDVGQPRRRAAGRPGTSTLPIKADSLTLHIVPGYVDLITGRCYGIEETLDFDRDGIFAGGTTKSGKHVDAIMEPNDAVIRFGSFSGDVMYGTLRRVDDGHYKGTTHWKTTCAGQSFDIDIDAYRQ
jgi:hypothetical protein